MQVMLGMLPMLVKEMKGGKGERISTAKGGERSQGGKGEDLGKKCLQGEREEKIFGRKRDIFLGGNRPYGAMGGQDLKRERGKKTLGREGWRSWGEKALGGNGGKDKGDELGVRKGLRGDRGERISIKEGGKSS